MNKFWALGFSLLLCLAGCKDSERKPLDGQSIKVNQKELMDHAKSWGLTTLETLGMTLDSTTKDQAVDILKSRGFTVILPGQDFLKNAAETAGSELFAQSLAKQLSSIGLSKNEMESIQDKFKKSSMVFAGDLGFQGKSSKLDAAAGSKKDLMFFVFDENKKLIMFFKQYPENKEAGLVLHESMKGTGIVNKGETKPTLLFGKDRSFAIVVKKDPLATSYVIFAPSIFGKYVDAFNRPLESWINSKEYEQFSKKETEYLKDFEGLPSKEYRKKREEFRSSKEYKEHRKKINEKLFHEFLKNLNESSTK